MNAAVLAALNTATRALAARGVRGTFEAVRLHAVLAVTFSSPFGSRVDVERGALHEAAERLCAAGFTANVVHLTVYVSEAAVAA